MARFSFVLIVTACLGVFNSVVFSQDDATSGGTIRGTITDVTEARNPIEGVEVKIVAQNGKEHTTKTDANGEYKRANLPAGRYLINIHKRGYNKRLGKPVIVVNSGDHFVPLRMGKKGNDANRWTEGLLRHVTESMGERYNLDKPVVEALHQSILEALNTVLEQMNRDVSEFATTGKEGSIGLLDGLFAHPDCRAAFTKYLTEAQLQDYIDFIKTLRRRDQQAVAQQITAWLDQELDLTADQRKSVEQLILDTAENESFPSAIGMLETDLQEALNLLQYELEVSLDGIVSQAQSKVWRGLVNTGKTGTHNGVVPSILESQLWQLTEAKLEAHTELLGDLDESASRRLTVAIKGTVQQYFETRDKDAETMFRKVEAGLMGLVEAGEMQPEHAVEELSDMRRDLGNEEGVIRRQLPRSDIIRHPLYQQAIKDVLSEDAFKQYKEIRTEKAFFHLQALRNLGVTCLDTQLIFDDAQREQLAMTASQLMTPLLNENVARRMFYQLLQQTDRKSLSPWQQEMVTFLLGGVEHEFRERMEKK